MSEAVYGLSESGSYVYGNDKLGFFETRHAAIGAAAIRGRTTELLGKPKNPDSRRRYWIFCQLRWVSAVEVEEPVSPCALDVLGGER